MSASEIVALAAPAFMKRGLSPPVVVQRGSFSTPSSIEIAVNGEKKVIQFWEGSHPDKVLAHSIFMDAMCALWDTSLVEATARLEQESQAQR